MDLTSQLYSLLLSFIFGGLFALELLFFCQLVNKMFYFFKWLISLIFVMVNAMIYFFLLLFVNNGIIHFYFFIMMIGGYLLFNKLFTYMFTHFRKKS